MRAWRFSAWEKRTACVDAPLADSIGCFRLQIGPHENDPRYKITDGRRTFDLFDWLAGDQGHVSSWQPGTGYTGRFAAGLVDFTSSSSSCCSSEGSYDLCSASGSVLKVLQTAVEFPSHWGVVLPRSLPESVVRLAALHQNLMFCCLAASQYHRGTAPRVTRSLGSK